MVMNVQYEGPHIYDFYAFRVRWTEPTQWGDQGKESNREYELQCWIEYRGRTTTIFNRRVNHNYQGYGENLRFPNDAPSIIQCQVRPWNSAGQAGPWRYSERIDISQVPIYFPGLPDYDLRGIDNANIIEVFRKIYSEGDTAEPGSESGPSAQLGHVNLNFKSPGASATEATSTRSTSTPVQTSSPQTAQTFDQQRPSGFNIPSASESAEFRVLSSFNRHSSGNRRSDQNDEFSMLFRPRLDVN